MVMDESVRMTERDGEKGRSIDRQTGGEWIMPVVEFADKEEIWRAFLEEKVSKRQMGYKEAAFTRELIEKKAYLGLAEAYRQRRLPEQLPVKHILSKAGSQKKRTVYSFEGEEGIFLKFVAWLLHSYDGYFAQNCYAFRKNNGVREAIRRICREKELERKYCWKVDISNYFNSIDVELLLRKLVFVQKNDPGLYQLFEKILREPRVREKKAVVLDRHGAMAGIPIAPFWANVYLAEVDAFFEKAGILYFRYSDDILIFAESEEELRKQQERLCGWLEELHLSVNPEKARIAAPGEYWEFLGFGYRKGQIDLSENTIRKTKAKIRRKADALRRWQRSRQLTPDKAAIGLIHSMNCKFYGNKEGREPQEDEFTWCRWFLPNLTTDRGLRIIDEYMQEYIRYAVTGRHYKGNYRISYETLKQWGYRSLVHEFWERRKL